jgi:hypothetical protein
VYYGTDSMPPYDGVSEFDVASPVDVGADTMRVLALPLWLDSTYHICATAVDASGWESPYSNVRAAPTGACIAGRTAYYSNAKPVADVRLVLAGSGVDTASTDANGDYALAAVPWYQDYSVTPSRTESQQSPAVTSYDAALVLRHAAHQDTLDSLQFRAADVTGDSTVSAMDAAYILQYAVAMRRHFPVGGDTVDWAFRPPLRVYDSLVSNQLNQDYKGILYGDPSGNWPGLGVLASWGGVTTGGPCSYFMLSMPTGGSTNDQVTMPIQYPSHNAQQPALAASGEPKGLSGEIAEPSNGTCEDAERLASPTRNDVRTQPLQAEVGMSSAEFVFPVMASKARNAVSADFLVRYDTRLLRLTGIRTTAATEGFMVAAADRGGCVRISMAGTRELNGDVALLELVFEPASGSAVQAPSLKLQAQDRSGNGVLETTSEAVVGQPLAAGSSSSGAVGRKPSAASPVAEVVWLVLNEGQARPGRLVEDGATGDKQNLPKQFSLSQPKPNPFGAGTSISYDLPIATVVKLAVFDAAGRKVRTLVNGKLAAGRYAVTWNGRDNAGKRIANGVYFVRMETDRFSFERKATLVRE